MTNFDDDSLPVAVRALFAQNNYEVTGPQQIHGAEIDLVARPLNDPFARTVYVEATTEYVDNTKYGKDLTKLMMIRQLVPDAHLLIVSSAGFTDHVRERANVSRVDTYTYDDLFRQFQRFEKYVELFGPGGRLGAEAAELNRVYEEPLFQDALGRDTATEYLTTWRDDPTKKSSWLIVTGEYGSGKTALTRILQYRWLEQYRSNPNLPLPLRIELRDFSRQFDARGLLHHFLDTNDLRHVPVDFAFSLIRAGRVVLLLDGYDEMAQYLIARERRACLEALAELAQGGAKGLLTSRPNYFTEGEELQVYEVLYRSLQQSTYVLDHDARAILERERVVDALLERFLDRFERNLQELTPTQTERLVERVLGDDREGADAVIGVLRSLIGTLEKGDSVSLSGKPVIVTYLLEVVEELKRRAKGERESPSDAAPVMLTEATVFKLIVDQLMLRDFRRSPETVPQDRRRFLRELAVFLSRKEQAVLREQEFRELIQSIFSAELRRAGRDGRQNALDRLFADMRSSATLTRAGTGDGWKFSHNSLREYLVFEVLTEDVNAGRMPAIEVKISEPMRMFAASLPEGERRSILGKLSDTWRTAGTTAGRGVALSLWWLALERLFERDGGKEQCLNAVAGRPVDLRGAEISRTTFSSSSAPSALKGLNANEAFLTDVAFVGADLTGAEFGAATLDGVSFQDATLSGANFAGALLSDVVMTGALVNGADFTGVKPNDVSLIVEDVPPQPGKRRLTGREALAYLRYAGAATDSVPDKLVWRMHPSFGVIEKIVEKLREQSQRQRRGLEQRGTAARDVRLARDFVGRLEVLGLIRRVKGRKDIVEMTDAGRDVFGRFIRNDELPNEIRDYVRNRFKRDFSRAGKSEPGTIS